MRLNASFATLVIAGLTFAPATLLAKRAHYAAPKVETASHKRAHKAAPNTSASKHTTKRRRKSQRVEDTPPPPTISRVRSTARTRTTQKIASSAEPLHPAEQRAEAAPRKATSDDFMRAASGLPAADEPAKPTTGISHPPDDDEESPRTPVSQPKSEPVAKTAPSTSRLATAKVSREIVAEDTAAPVIQPLLYNKRGRLIVPRPLKGSHEILVRQNLMADSEGLDRIKDDDDLDAMRDRGLLVVIPTSVALEVDDRLPSNRRYCRPWTAQFLAALARAHYARFHTPLQVNSAVRTVEFQQRLQRTNGNAAPAEGETASPHLTGQAVDLAKHGLSLTEIAWLRGYLLPLVQQGKIDVEEEFQQSCFHISVYKRYLPATSTPKREIATGHRNGTAALATAMP